MTVTVQTPLTEYTAASGATVFATSFRLITPSDLTVLKNGVVITSGFTVTGFGQTATATVTFTTPMVGGEVIQLRRVIKLERQNNYQFEGDFQANVVNEDYDRLWMSQQDQELSIDENEAAAAITELRNLRVPVGEALGEMPNAAACANKLLAMDSTGRNPIFVLPGTGTASEVLIQLANQINPALGDNQLGHYDSIAPAYLKNTSDMLNGYPVSFLSSFVKKAKHDGIRAGTNTDDWQTALDDAMASPARVINLPVGKLRHSGTIALTANGQGLVGPGSRHCELVCTSASAPSVTLANGVASFSVKGMRISRSVPATAGARAVKCFGTTDNTELYDLYGIGHEDAFEIGTCDVGTFKQITAAKNTRYGVYNTNSSLYGPSQWEINDLALLQNGSDGFRVQSTLGVPGMILGTWQSIKTFANSGRGIHLVGSAATPIYDLRLTQGFIGDDALGGIRADTYGGKHRIQAFIERIGRGPTGPTYTTPASNTGDGLEVTGNNSDFNVSGSIIDECSYNGILHNGGILIVAGSSIYNNGQSATAGQRNGVLSQGGRLVVSGNIITNIGGASQLFGVATSHDNVVIGVNDLSGNATAPTALGGLTNAQVVGNSPLAQVTRIPGAIGPINVDSLTAGNPVGGNLGFGTVNVATNAAKNANIFNNP
jgi:hypothetical protein